MTGEAGEVAVKEKSLKFENSSKLFQTLHHVVYLSFSLCMTSSTTTKTVAPLTDKCFFFLMFFQLTNDLFYYIEVLICDLWVSWEREASDDKKWAQTVVIWAPFWSSPASLVPLLVNYILKYYNISLISQKKTEKSLTYGPNDALPDAPFGPVFVIANIPCPNPPCTSL